MINDMYLVYLYCSGIPKSQFFLLKTEVNSYKKLVGPTKGTYSSCSLKFYTLTLMEFIGT